MYKRQIVLCIYHNIFFIFPLCACKLDTFSLHYLTFMYKSQFEKVPISKKTADHGFHDQHSMIRTKNVENGGKIKGSSWQTQQFSLKIVHRWCWGLIQIIQRIWIQEMKEKSFLQLQAYDSIKNGILNGELVPGQLYSETKLSAQIGISRTPMREALQCLSQDGYCLLYTSRCV